MPAVYQFEPAAQAEYNEAVRYYALEANPVVASHFIASIELALARLSLAPERWRVAEPPDIRRLVLRRYPFVFYYRYKPADNAVIIYALMHTSRRPGYWRGRPSEP